MFTSLLIATCTVNHDLFPLRLIRTGKQEMAEKTNHLFPECSNLAMNKFSFLVSLRLVYMIIITKDIKKGKYAFGPQGTQPGGGGFCSSEESRTSMTTPLFHFHFHFTCLLLCTVYTIYNSLLYLMVLVNWSYGL